MDRRPPRNTAAGGFALATGALGGALIGAAGFHQPTIGLLVGVGVGTIIALAVWLVDRR
ncbi:hypothetical protein LK533_02500 [Sphingomonas sp. PL-96]|uniref:hypothetical protein n=1 Tax=Sphingomonas sp. PL-96 TaxID=2887201 RepID=UPI001E2D8636|nr:hypothetical protein [Sphingomonas sp. PL-96]MCC2975544.1 hypothetical protein [Sphingomonas sp. PL-96]